MRWIGTGTSVADPGCLSRILIFIHPGSRISDPGSRISDPTTAPKDEGDTILSYLFCSHKYHKIVNNFIFKKVKKFFLAQTLRIIILLTQKFVIKLSKIPVWGWDPGSGKNLFRIQDPKGTGSRIQFRNTVGYGTLFKIHSRPITKKNLGRPMKGFWDTLSWLISWPITLVEIGAGPPPTRKAASNRFR